MTFFRTPKHGILLLVTAILAVCCVPTTTPSPTPTPDPIDIARTHTQAGEFTAAETILREATITRPDDPYLHLELAALYKTWHRPRDGLKALSAASQLGATTNQTAHLQIELLAAVQNWNQVIIEATQQLNVAPNDPIALKTLTQANLHLQKCTEAAKIAQRWHKAASEDRDATKIWGALTDNGLSLCEVDDELCTIAESCCSGQYHKLLGMTLIRAGDWALSACILSKAVAEGNATAETYAWLGEALTRTGHHEEAHEYLIQATTLAPSAPLPWLMLGTYYFKQQEFAASREVLLRANQLDPNNPAPCLMIAEIKAQTGQYDQADVWLKAATHAASNDATVWKAVTRFYLQRHLVDAPFLQETIEYTIRLAPKDGEAFMLRGWLQLMRGDVTNALTTLEEATTLAPNLGQAHYLYGQALQAAGSLKHAQDAFTRAADLGYWP